MQVMKQTVTGSSEATFSSKVVQSASDVVTGWTTGEQEFESRRDGLQSICSPPRLKWAPCSLLSDRSVAYPGILFGGGGGSTNSVEDRGQRERGSGGGRPVVRGSGGRCNLLQEISFHVVKVSSFLVL